MRIAVAGMSQEACTFNPTPTTLASFQARCLVYGTDVIDDPPAAAGKVLGFVQTIRRLVDDVEIVPSIAARTTPGGRIAADALAYFRSTIVDGLRAAGDLDGMAFCLHGASAAEGVDDPEGYLLEAVREVVGPDLPVGVSLDHHANITTKMVELATFIIGDRTQPHDNEDTGRLLAEMLVKVVAGEVDPVMVYRKLPLIAHQEQYLTMRPPMKTWFDLARAHEEADSPVVAASTFPMQPWLDVAEAGFSVVVVADRGRNDAIAAVTAGAADASAGAAADAAADAGAARVAADAGAADAAADATAADAAADAGAARVAADATADELADLAWSLREDFQVKDSVSPAQAVAQAQDLDGFVTMSDTGDSVFGGSGGDSTTLLVEFLRHGGKRALIPLVEPSLGQQITLMGGDLEIGQQVTLSVGGGVTGWWEPIEVTGAVRAMVADYAASQPDPLYHASLHFGPTVALEVANVLLFISERSGMAGNHPAQYRDLGIDIDDYDVAVLKTASNFQDWAADLTTNVVRANTPGPTQSDVVDLPWARIPRPIFPLDPQMTTWR